MRTHTHTHLAVDLVVGVHFKVVSTGAHYLQVDVV